MKTKRLTLVPRLLWTLPGFAIKATIFPNIISTAVYLRRNDERPTSMTSAAILSESKPRVRTRNIVIHVFDRSTEDEMVLQLDVYRGMICSKYHKTRTFQWRRSPSLRVSNCMNSEATAGSLNNDEPRPSWAGRAEVQPSTSQWQIRPSRQVGYQWKNCFCYGQTIDQQVCLTMVSHMTANGYSKFQVATETIHTGLCVNVVLLTYIIILLSRSAFHRFTFVGFW